MELSGACAELVKSSESSRLQLKNELAEEKQRNAEDRTKIISQMTAYMAALLEDTGASQEARWADRVECVERDITKATTKCQKAQAVYEKSMDAWMDSEHAILAGVLKSRDGIKSKIKTDWTVSDALGPTPLVIVDEKRPLTATTER